ncbi:putative C6 transcription factor [Fusarium solani]|uniref:C6 transcription factor n=1 Tax=Fusarium solani TaxID=169388 RepID=A0A9P9GJD9_FUSSL|nr:putative C6 transcription factor [Fusarium solani]KAH7239645.1 putative C6 transcription factor [Fusarium solani]
MGRLRRHGNSRASKAVKQHVRNLRKSQNRDRQAGRDRHSAASTIPPQVPSENPSTPPSRAVLVLSPPSRPEHVPEDAFHELGESCSGDLVSPSSGHSHDPAQDERSTSTGPHSTFACVFRPESASLVMHYLDHVFSWQYPYFQPRSRLGNRGWLLTYLSNGGPLYHAALALSALHRNKVQISRRKDYLRNQEAFDYHSKALRELCELSQRAETEALLNDKFQLAEFAASSLMLISFEVFNGAEYDWLPHLDAVTTLLSTLSPEVLLQHSTSPNRTDTANDSDEYAYKVFQAQPDFDFLIVHAIWFDILSCVSTGRVPRIAYRQWLEASNLDMADLMGCYNWVMISIGDLAQLQAWKSKMKEQGTLSVPDLVTRSREVETRLEDGIEKLESIIEENTEAPWAAWVSHIFALASLILSSTIVSGPWESLPEISMNVNKAVNVLREWPRAISLQGLVWPLCVIGCMAEPKHQPFLESLLSNFVDECGGFGNGNTVLRIMRSCWTWQRKQERKGMDLAFQTGVPVLLI